MSELAPKPLSKAEYIEATGISGNELVEDKNEALEAAEKVDKLETDRALQVGALEMLGNYYSNLPDGEQMTSQEDGGIYEVKNKLIEDIEADLDQQVVDGMLSPQERAQINKYHPEDIRVRAADLANLLYRDAIITAAAPQFKEVYDKMDDIQKDNARLVAVGNLRRNKPGVEPSQADIEKWIVSEMIDSGTYQVPKIIKGITNDEIMGIADANTGANVSELDKAINSVYETGKTADQHNRSEKVQSMVNKYRQRSSN